MTDQKNLVLAIALSIAILLGFQLLYETPRLKQRQAETARQQTQELAMPLAAGSQPNPATSGAVIPGIGAPTGAPPAAAILDRGVLIRQQFTAGDRIRIETPRLHGSVNLVGGRIDDLTLADYRETVDPKSPEIVLLSPGGSTSPYYAEFGWVAEAAGVAVPDANTRWTTQSNILGPDHPLQLSWDNGAGLVFERTISVDQNYMFTVVQQVRNATTQPVTLLPYGLISRHGTPQTSGYYILHEGPVGVVNDKLHEHAYKELKEKGTVTDRSTGGWIGITDKYWLTALVPDQQAQETARFLYSQRGAEDRYQVDTLGDGQVIAPGATVESTARMFAGAKLVRLIDDYADRLNIHKFDLAIDFGWFYFLTKPFFYALDFLGRLFGNFGIAILVFTVCVKALFYPLANKSYRSMSKMKKLQPEMTKIKERYESDRARMNEEMMALYKREKVNPVSGCLPIVIQIPVFFALYKVLFVTIEMRQAPFFGWIQDLSVPDPTTVFNLFGLIPWTPPHMLMIGVWPLIMGVSMFLQQKMNPAPPDPIQQKVFMFLPILFTFMLANFPAGLVIYWAWNNSLSIAQQWMIMRSMGVKVT